MTQKQLTNQYEVSLHEQILKVFHASEIRLHDNHLGSRVYSNYQRVALIVLFMRSRKALRSFVSELYESKWPKWLGLREIPSYRTLHHWLTKWNLSWIRKILAKTISKEKPSLMAIDATGFDSWARSRHYNKRLNDFKIRNPHLPYNKVDLLVDTKSKLVYDFVLRTKPRHDVLGAETMIKRFKHKNCLVLADRGYDSENLHELITKRGNIFYAPVRDFKVNRPKGRYRRRCVEKHEKYGMRSIVESINFSLKSRFRSLRCKLHYMKKREFGWKVITYNLEKLSQVDKIIIYMLKRIGILNMAYICLCL
jgi:hypothetical protein